MPYIVTTTTFPEDGLGPERTHGIVARRAVATLDGAREAVQDAVGNATPEGQPAVGIDFMHEAESLPESGGTVGPLPDGTVIEVEPCDRFWLLSEMGASEHDSRPTAEIIDAYNAASGDAA